MTKIIITLFFLNFSFASVAQNEWQETFFDHPEGNIELADILLRASGDGFLFVTQFSTDNPFNGLLIEGAEMNGSLISSASDNFSSITDLGYYRTQAYFNHSVDSVPVPGFRPVMSIAQVEESIYIPFATYASSLDDCGGVVRQDWRPSFGLLFKDENFENPVQEPVLTSEFSCSNHRVLAACSGSTDFYVLLYNKHTDHLIIRQTSGQTGNVIRQDSLINDTSMADLAEDHITLARIHDGQLSVTRGDDTTYSYPLTDLLPNEVNPGEVIVGNYDGSLWIGINYFTISPIRHGFVFLNLSRTGDMIKNQLDFNDGTKLKDVQEYQGLLLLLQDREPVYSFSEFLPDPIRISVLNATEWYVQRLEDFGSNKVLPKRLLIEDGVATVAGTQENNYLPLEIRTTDRVYFAQRDVSLLTSSGSTVVSDDRPLIYPNPARNTVSVSPAVELCMIYDSFGRLIHTEKPLGRINISTFPSGSYIMKMRTISGKFRTEKFIVK